MCSDKTAGGGKDEIRDVEMLECPCDDGCV